MEFLKQFSWLIIYWLVLIPKFSWKKMQTTLNKIVLYWAYFSSPTGLCAATELCDVACDTAIILLIATLFQQFLWLVSWGLRFILYAYTSASVCRLVLYPLRVHLVLLTFMLLVVTSRTTLRCTVQLVGEFYFILF